MNKSFSYKNTDGEMVTIEYSIDYDKRTIFFGLGYLNSKEAVMSMVQHHEKIDMNLPEDYHENIDFYSKPENFCLVWDVIWQTDKDEDMCQT